MSNSTFSAQQQQIPRSVVADLCALVGRVLMAVLFIPAGFSKLMGFAGAAGYIASKGLPLPEVGAAMAIAVELGAGIALLLGYKPRIAAIVLALFTLAASVFFHDFWNLADPAQRMVQTLLFNKNIAVVGGLLVIAGLGAGRLAIDKG